VSLLKKQQATEGGAVSIPKVDNEELLCDTDQATLHNPKNYAYFFNAKVRMGTWFIMFRNWLTSLTPRIPSVGDKYILVVAILILWFVSAWMGYDFFLRKRQKVESQDEHDRSNET